jgi:hypothetical protein
MFSRLPKEDIALVVIFGSMGVTGTAALIYNAIRMNNMVKDLRNYRLTTPLLDDSSKYPFYKKNTSP